MSLQASGLGAEAEGSSGGENSQIDAEAEKAPCLSAKVARADGQALTEAELEAAEEEALAWARKSNCC